MMNGLRTERMDTSVTTGSRHRRRQPYTSALPTWGSTGRKARRRPRGVSCSRASRASMSTRRFTAFSRASSSGGVSARRRKRATPPRPWAARSRTRTCRQSCSSEVRTISGSWYSSSSRSFERGKRCQHLPGLTRPARPRRCVALARETHAGSSAPILFSASYVFSLWRPLSITKTTSSMVMLLSAMFVEMTILRMPSGGGLNTSFWLAVGIWECSGKSRHWPASGRACSASCTLEISPQPVRKMSMAPSAGSVRWMCATSSWMSSRGSSSSSNAATERTVASE
mmetsp:Transcript_12022/g.40673  ORF Transcript_12022/g.40673 Transcript_12022/m.40673 type:complete len:284 (+) Transcript_12022:860-1711(+)